MGRKNVLTMLAMVGILGVNIVGCGANNAGGGEASVKETATEISTETKTQTEALVDISKIEPYAAKEVQTQLDNINKNISSSSKTGDEAVIKEAVNIMGMACGNSLDENQIKLVVKNWKQKQSADTLKTFNDRFATVYNEYSVLSGSGAEAELKKAGLSIKEKDYCGKGKLDMVEWINSSIK